MGTSIGLALRKHCDAYDIVGWDPDSRSLADALDCGAVNRTAESLRDAAHEADIALLAAPVDRIVCLAEQLARTGPPELTVTDVGSAKRRIVRECEALLGGRFVGGHPMAGSELNGPRAARAEILDGSPWVFTPTEVTKPAALEAAEALARASGAKPRRMTPYDHDRMAAFLSHLPHVLAFALSATASSGLDADAMELAAGSFRSATRVAGSSPSAWASILTDNAESVAEALDRLLDRLRAVRSALGQLDGHALERLLSEGLVK